MEDDHEHSSTGTLVTALDLAALRADLGNATSGYGNIRRRGQRYLMARFSSSVRVLQPQERDDIVSDAIAEKDVQACIKDLTADAAAVSERLERALNRVRMRKVRDLKRRGEVPLVTEPNPDKPTIEDKQIAKAVFVESARAMARYLKEAFDRLSDRDRALLSEAYNIRDSNPSPRATLAPMDEGRLKVALFRARHRFLKRLAEVLPDAEDASPDLQRTYDYLRSKEFAQVLFKRRQLPLRGQT